DEARAMRDRVKEESVKQRADELIGLAHISIAREMRDKVDYPQAEDHYKAAMQADPDNPLPALELADLLQRTPARRIDAIPLYEKGIELARLHEGSMDEAKLLEYRFQTGKLFFDEGQFNEAATVFLEVTRADQNFRFPQAVDLAVE